MHIHKYTFSYTLGYYCEVCGNAMPPPLSTIQLTNQYVTNTILRNQYI